MTNIVILTNSAKYSYHSAVGRMIYDALYAENHNLCVLDISSCQYDQQCLAQITEFQPDVIITLDLTGFRFRTQSGEAALNMLGSKNLNLIWGDKPEYAPLLNKKLSLSMLFYDVSGSDNRLDQCYSDLLYYKAIGKLPLSAVPSYDDKRTFAAIWQDFTKEVLLSEA